MRIAILGASSHIARSLMPFFDKDELHTFGRLDSVLEGTAKRKGNPLKNYTYDMIINCVGVRKSADVNFADYFFVTEAYDNLVIDALKDSPKTKYIFFSTGAVHYFKGVQDINNENCCAIAKINAEAKHRALPHLNITDIRLYSYFTKYANLNEHYFMNEAVRCVKENKTFITGRGNFYRNYIRNKDLYGAIISLEGNGAREIGAKCNTTKIDILEYLKKEYGLKYKVKRDYKPIEITGNKQMYVPIRKDIETNWTSLQTIREACYEILGR